MRQQCRGEQEWVCSVSALAWCISIHEAIMLTLEPVVALVWVIVQVCDLSFLHVSNIAHTHTRARALKLLGESVWVMLLLLLLHSGHHSETQNGRVLLHYAEALLYCVHVWQQMRQELHGGKTTVRLSITHCSATTPTKWRQQEYLFFLHPGAPERGCRSDRCGTRHHFPPFEETEKKTVPHMDWTTMRWR